MKIVEVHNILRKRALVSRDSARELQVALDRTLSASDAEIGIDFSDVDAIGPSFMDEILAVLEERFAALGSASFKVVVLNPPTRLSAKFSAVARAHDSEIEEKDNGSWVLLSAVRA